MEALKEIIAGWFKVFIALGLLVVSIFLAAPYGDTAVVVTVLVVGPLIISVSEYLEKRKEENETSGE